METKHIVFIVLGVIGILTLIIGGCVAVGVLVGVESVSLLKQDFYALEEIASRGDAEEAITYCSEKTKVGTKACLILAAEEMFINQTEYRDGSLCRYIDSSVEQDACFIAYAAHWKDESLCAEVFGNREREIFCSAGVQNDTKLCNELDREIRRNCVSFVEDAWGPFLG